LNVFIDFCSNDPQAFHDMIKKLTGKDAQFKAEPQKRRNSLSTIKERVGNK
jgi:septum formation inhibitor-activating ATPase MinD